MEVFRFGEVLKHGRCEHCCPEKQRSFPNLSMVRFVYSAHGFGKCHDSHEGGELVCFTVLLE